MGILLIVFPFSMSSTYFKKSRSRWKPYGVSTEYGGFPVTPFSLVFLENVFPVDIRTRHECPFKGNIEKKKMFYLFVLPSCSCLQLFKQIFFFNVWKKNQRQIISETSIKHKNSRRDYLIFFLNYRGEGAIYLRFHSGISSEGLNIAL